MPSLFAGTDRLICDALHIEDRKHLKRKSAKLEPLSNETAFRLVQRLYGQLADNLPGQPRSSSEELWRCRHATDIRNDNRRTETLLEKAVAILAHQGHMPGWFNQCPVATGIADPHADVKRSVDLVHLCGPTLRLVELKWMSDTLPFALFEVLEYGLAYLLARLHKRELRLEVRPLMQDSVRHVRLEVVTPREFFRGTSHRDLFSRMHNALAKFAKAQTNGDWSMSLHTLVFPDSFDTVPFASGKAVKEVCARYTLAPAGCAVRDAFADLAPVPPDRFLPGVPGSDIERILDAAPGKELETGISTDPHPPPRSRSTPSASSSTAPSTSRRCRVSNAWAGQHVRSRWSGPSVFRGPAAGIPSPIASWPPAPHWSASNANGSSRSAAATHTGFSDTFWRPVWGDRMVGYQHVRDLLRGNKDLYAHLDAAQLVKHALALRAAVQSGKEYHGLAPILLYVYAEPDAWPDTGRHVPDDEKARHREETASFANHVGGDEVAFSACSFRQLLDAWRRGPDQGIARHAAAVIDRLRTVMATARRRPGIAHRRNPRPVPHGSPSGSVK